MIDIKSWTEYYKDLFGFAPDQSVLIKELGKNFSTPVKVLDAECGHGILAAELAQSMSVTATDTYNEFVSLVLDRQLNSAVNFPVFNLKPSEVGQYLGKNFFNIILCLNYRIVFLKDRNSIWKFLESTKTLLTENGYLVVEIFNFSKYDFSNPTLKLPVWESSRAKVISKIEKNHYSDTYQLSHKVISSGGRVINAVFEEKITPISMETLKSFSEEIGFSEIKFYKDYQFSPYDNSTDKIICVLKK